MRTGEFEGETGGGAAPRWFAPAVVGLAVVVNVAVLVAVVVGRFG